MLDADYYARLGLGCVFEKVMNGERLSIDDGRKLFACEDINALGALAHHVRTCMHNDSTYYVLNRHVNYTNVCVNDCLFCAYQKQEDDQEGAFRLDIDGILRKLDPEDGLSYDEVHIVGGCHPKIPLSFFEEAIKRIKEIYPTIVVKAFTAVEIAHFAELEGISTQEVLERLKNAGLEAMPGGGAEIFAPAVREEICPKKATGEEWLKVAREAHRMGITSNCTMLFGHLESIDDRLDHLDKLRTLQDETNGFTCFIPLPFLTENSKLKLPEECKGKQTGLDKLRTIAVSRLMLDNIPHIKAYWVMLGIKLAQAALHYGADDLDGTIVEERIGHDAGAQSDQAMTIPQLEEMIERSGFAPIRRDTFFKPIQQEK